MYSFLLKHNVLFYIRGKNILLSWVPSKRKTSSEVNIPQFNYTRLFPVMTARERTCIGDERDDSSCLQNKTVRLVSWSEDSSFIISTIMLSS